jgi:outer membrane protein TolC
MTSFAFILGVLPLAIATGAGAAARNSVGTAVAGGMLASTFLSIVFIPVLYVVIRTLVPGRRHRVHDDGGGAGGAEGAGGALGAAGAVVLLLALATPATAQTAVEPSMERLDFDAAIARAIEKNPSIAIASTSILRSEALLQQVRATTRPTVGGFFTNTTLDSGRGFDGLTVQPQNQSLFALNVSAPVLAAAQWAARAQAEDQIGVARLSVADIRRQIAVAAAQAYLAVITQKRLIDVSQRALETAQAQLDYNRKRVQGGVGTRLNELRSAQEVATDEAILEVLRLSVRRAQEALGVLVAADGPIDTTGEPSFEVPSVAVETDWLSARPDLRLFTAQQAAASRVVQDSSKDWWPTANVSFDPQYLTPGGLFQPSGTWRFTLSVSQPIYDGGSRRALRREREASLDAAGLTVTQGQIRARAEERIARAAVASQERALASARLAATQANEVLKITIVAFDAGASTNIEVIDAQRSARDLETAVTQGEDALRQARLDLLVALGRFPR